MSEISTTRPKGSSGETRTFPLDPAGWPFILGAFALAAVLGSVLGAVAPAWAWVAAPFALAGLFSTWFFRDPHRVLPADATLVVSPADGKVTQVDDGPDGVFVSIFLNVFDVHVNRSPVAGRVRETTYRPGAYHAAWRADVGEVNERNHIVLDTDRGPVEVVQIAGLVARRIVCRTREGAELRRGERIGIIRFGSCTQLRLPPGYRAEVSPGDRVRGASSVVARWVGETGS
jgi:phosphatidylserine decarboxylase